MNTDSGGGAQTSNDQDTHREEILLDCKAIFIIDEEG